MRRVAGSATSISIRPVCESASGLRSVPSSNESRTAAASTGEPSENFQSGRSRMVKLPSAAGSALSAICGTTIPSGATVNSVSAMPCDCKAQPSVLMAGLEPLEWWRLDSLMLAAMAAI